MKTIALPAGVGTRFQYITIFGNAERVNDKTLLVNKLL